MFGRTISSNIISLAAAMVLALARRLDSGRTPSSFSGNPQQRRSKRSLIPVRYRARVGASHLIHVVHTPGVGCLQHWEHR